MLLSWDEKFLDEILRRLPLSQKRRLLEEKKKHSKDRRWVDLIILQQLRLELMEQINQLQEQIDALLEQRDHVGRTMEALERVLKTGRKTGSFDLEDPLVREAIRKWEQQEGRACNSEEVPEVLLLALNSQRKHYDHLSMTINEKQQEQTVLWEQLEQVEAALQGQVLSREELEDLQQYHKEGILQEGKGPEEVSSSSGQSQSMIIDLSKVPSF